MRPEFDNRFVVRRLVDELSYDADFTGAPPGRTNCHSGPFTGRPDAGPGRNRPRFDIMVGEHD
jgi:hypothetical protein